MDDPSRRDAVKLLAMLLAGGAVLPEAIEAAQAVQVKPSLEQPIRTTILQREQVRGSMFETWYLETESVGSNNAKLVSKGVTTRTDGVTTIHMSVAGHENASDPVPTFTSEYSLTLHQRPLDEKHAELSGHYVLNGKLTAFGPIKAVRQANLPVDPTNEQLVELINRRPEGRKP